MSVLYNVSLRYMSIINIYNYTKHIKKIGEIALANLDMKSMYTCIQIEIC